VTGRQIAPFLAISFGLTWGLAAVIALLPDLVTDLFGPVSMTHPLFLLAVYAPGIAAVMLVFRASGIDGLGRFLSRLFIWRAHPGWYLLVLLGVPLLMTGAAWLGDGLEAWSYPYLDDSGAASVAALLLGLGATLVIGPVEELGWRGVLLPLLQQRHAPFVAGLLVGLFWTLWHVPAFLLSGTPQSGFDFLPFVVGTMSVAMIMTVMFNATAGSLLLPVLMHFQLNNPLTPDSQPLDAWGFLLLAGVLVWFWRESMFVRGGVAEVVPERSP
jgi:membrane protease YdiL (CAAX protease family)